MKRDVKRRLFAALVAAACLIAMICLLASCNREDGAVDTSDSAGTETVETVADTTAAPDTTEDGSTPATEPVTEEETDPVETEPAPTFSVKGGLYTSDLSVELSAAEEYTIRYTLDGSIPGWKSVRTKTYTEPITLKADANGNGTVIRAACFTSDGTLVGNVTTETYVPVEEMASTLYTVMISVDKKDLSDMTSNYTQKIERPAHVEIVTPEGERVISQDAGLRLFGGSSREQAQKSFKIIARKDGYFGEDTVYTGKGTFHYELFPDRIVKAGEDAGEVLDRYDSFILRNGGNDSMLATNESKALLSDLCDELKAQVSPAIERHIERWSYANGDYTTYHWSSSVRKIKDFISRRPAYFKEDLEAACAIFE